MKATQRTQCVIWFIILIAISAAAIAMPNTARACSCNWDSMRGGELLGVDGEIPASTRGIFWWDERAEPKASNFVVEHKTADGVEKIPVKVERRSFYRRKNLFLIVPETPMGVGESYTFKYLSETKSKSIVSGLNVATERTVKVSATCAEAGQKIALNVSPVKRSRLVLAAAVSCRTSFDAPQTTVTVVWPAELASFKDQALYVTFVDGELWEPSSSLCSWPKPGNSWVGLGKDRIFAECAKSLDTPPR